MNYIKKYYQKIKATYQRIKHNIKALYKFSREFPYVIETEDNIETTYARFGVTKLKSKFAKKHKQKLGKLTTRLRILAVELDRLEVGRNTGVSSLIGDYFLMRFFILKINRLVKFLYPRSNFFGIFGFSEIFYVAALCEKFYKKRHKHYKNIRLFLRDEISFDPQNDPMFKEEFEVLKVKESRYAERPKLSDKDRKKLLATKAPIFSLAWVLFAYANNIEPKIRNKLKYLKTKYAEITKAIEIETEAKRKKLGLKKLKPFRPFKFLKLKKIEDEELDETRTEILREMKFLIYKGKGIKYDDFDDIEDEDLDETENDVLEADILEEIEDNVSEEVENDILEEVEEDISEEVEDDILEEVEDNILEEVKEDILEEVKEDISEEAKDDISEEVEDDVLEEKEN